MIVSKINEHMKYESPDENNIVVYPFDEDYDADTYDINIDGNKVEVAVGQFNDDDPFHLVRYCHVYLVKKDRVVDRIGVVELEHEEEDKDDINIEDHMLYFNKPKIKKILDDHSQFGGAEEEIAVEKETKDEGLGIKITGDYGQEKKITKVRSSKYGFKEGDIILQVNDKDVINMELREVIHLIKNNSNVTFKIDREEAPTEEPPLEDAGGKEEHLVCDYIPRPSNINTWDIPQSADLNVTSSKSVEYLLFQDSVYFLQNINLVENLKQKNSLVRRDSPQTPEIDEDTFEEFKDIFQCFFPDSEAKLETRKTLFPQNYQAFVSQKNEFEEKSVMKQRIKTIQASKSKKGVYNLWINYLFKDNDYQVINPPADGSCLFYTFQKAFYSIGLYIPIKKLREIQKFFISYDRLSLIKDIVGPWIKSVKQTENEIKQISDRYRLKHSEKDKTPLDLLKPELEAIKKSYNEKVKELNNLISRENPLPADTGDVGFFYREKIIDDNGEFIGDINSYFKKFLDYKVYNDWGDENTLIDLADALKIKLIILEKNVVARELNTDGVSNLAKYLSFRGNVDNPLFFMILTLSDSHYQLVSYKNKCLFSEPELPYTLKYLIKQNLLFNKSDILHDIINTNFSQLEQTIRENRLNSVFDLHPWSYENKILNNTLENVIPGSSETAGQFVVSSDAEVETIFVDLSTVSRLFGNYKTILLSSDDTIKSNAIATSKATLIELLQQFGDYFIQKNRIKTISVENIPEKIHLTNITETPF